MKTMETLRPGDEFTWKGQRYKVAQVFPPNSRHADIAIPTLSAWRFIKTTQKFSGNAYLYGLPKLIADGAQPL